MALVVQTVLGIINATLLVICLVMVTRQNQFFPNTTKRSWLYPWSSCFDFDCSHEECCSQFLLDEYTFTHYSHGYTIFYWGIIVPLRCFMRSTCPDFALEPKSFDLLGLQLVALIEISWEIGENSPAVVQKFREKRESDFRGDSGINVVGDLGIALLGFVVMQLTWMQARGTWKLPFGMAVFYEVSISVILWIWLCDGLTVIWLNLTTLADIPVCGPRLTELMLTLGMLVLFITFLIPVIVSRRARHASVKPVTLNA